MSNLYKTTALLFSVVLLYISTNTENYSLLLTSKLQNSECENFSSYSSTEKPNLFSQNRQGERYLNSIKNLPVFNLKNHANDLYSNSLSPTIKKMRINSEYLSYSETINRNLTNSDIVFPFHYFW